MPEIIYKVAERGEGKTRWLVEQAHKELTRGENVVLLTNGAFGYKDFVENYYATFNEICKVDPVEDNTDIPHDCVVLIDNLFLLRKTLDEVNNISYKVKRMYITVEGILSTEFENEPDKTAEYQQISIFDNVEGDNI